MVYRYMHSLKPAMVEDGPNVPDLWRTIESYAAKGRELFNASPEDEEGDFMTMLDSVEREAKWLERTIQSRETANVCPLEQVSRLGLGVTVEMVVGSILDGGI